MTHSLLITATFPPHLGHTFTTFLPQSHHIPVTAQPHFHHIPTTFLTHSLFITATFPPHLGHAFTTFLPQSHHIPVTAQPHFHPKPVSFPPHFRHIPTTAEPHFPQIPTPSHIAAAFLPHYGTGVPPIRASVASEKTWLEQLSRRLHWLGAAYKHSSVRAVLRLVGNIRDKNIPLLGQARETGVAVKTYRKRTTSCLSCHVCVCVCPVGKSCLTHRLCEGAVSRAECLETGSAYERPWRHRIGHKKGGLSYRQLQQRRATVSWTCDASLAAAPLQAGLDDAVQVSSARANRSFVAATGPSFALAVFVSCASSLQPTKSWNASSSLQEGLWAEKAELVENLTRTGHERNGHEGKDGTEGWKEEEV
ncbi:unnamed protein product [Protopolystoma xenopodis]|uniref:4Fe-4S ferredoxin-type domain-containing protein n=1 Tax=Protopolystoma xenopodis TaxID=117903 RepID=A0A448XPA7_9PLAT|nr:unnamed protein product [Protopolystoma xenopodis]